MHVLKRVRQISVSRVGAGNSLGLELEEKNPVVEYVRQNSDKKMSSGQRRNLYLMGRGRERGSRLEQQVNSSKQKIEITVDDIRRYIMNEKSNATYLLSKQMIVYPALFNKHSSKNAQLLPWETLGIHHNRGSSITIVHTRLVHQEQSGNSRDIKRVSQRLTKIRSVKRNSQPGHGSEILLKVLLASIEAAEHHFEVLSSSLQLKVGLAKLGSEHTARRAPVRTTSIKQHHYIPYEK